MNEGVGIRTLVSTKLTGPKPVPFDRSGTPSGIKKPQWFIKITVKIKAKDNNIYKKGKKFSRYKQGCRSLVETEWVWFWDSKGVIWFCKV